jgi:hypothetical protein
VRRLDLISEEEFDTAMAALLPPASNVGEAPGSTESW